MSTEIKEHRIENIGDIFEVIDKDNFERFMKDFYIFIMQVGQVKEQVPDIKVSYMLWKDDGKHEIVGMVLNGKSINFKMKD